MAQDGIYDLAFTTTRSCGRCCAPGTWFQLQDLRREAEQARERLAAHLARTNRIASRFEAKWMRTADAQERASWPADHGVRMLELLLGLGQGCWVRARGAGRREVLVDADAP
jgi:hypothetical protein